MNIDSSEHEIIRGCIKGDARSQRTLFDSYKGRMMTVCRRYARDESESEDLLLMAFNRIFRYLSKYKGTGNLYSWMRTVTVNVCLRYLEKNKKHFYHNDVEEEVKLEISTPTALDHIAEEEILNLVQGMPDGYRTVFNMYVIDGFSHIEIAEKFNFTAATSRSQLLKARRWLQAKVQEQKKIRI